MDKIAIIGTGITGLTAAYSLHKSGYDVHLFEKNFQVGGAVKSSIQNGWLTEFGPNTLLMKDENVLNFLKDLGLGHKIREANQQASKRYIVKNGELSALPLSIKEAITTPILTWRGKLRLMAELFIKKRKQGADESVAGFVERRFGRELLDYGINPFIAGIFANRPENLSLKHAFPPMYKAEQRYGSMIWAAIAAKNRKHAEDKIPRQLISFDKGLQQIPMAIAENLEHIFLNTKIKKISQTAEGKWILHHGKEKTGPYRHVILNIPVYQWNDSFFPGSRSVQSVINKVNYPPLSVLHFGYKKEDVTHPLDGFGFLVPEVEERMILGALFSSTLFEGRAPEGHHLLTVFVGGGRQPGLAPRSTRQLIEIAENELKNLIGLKGPHVFKEHVFWPKSIPGYHVGYGRILNKFYQLEHDNPGLHLAGNFRHGVSVPDCIKNGLKTAERIIQFPKK